MGKQSSKTLIRDLTEGSVTKLLLVFAFPLLCSNLLQTVYNMVDMIVIGQFVGSTGLSAVSIGGDVLACLTFLVMGFNGKLANEWKIKYIQAFNAMERQIKDGLPSTPEEKLDLLVEVAHNQKAKVERIDERVTHLEKNARIDPTQYGYIGNLVNKRLQAVKEVYKYQWTKQQCGALRHGINRDICNAMDARPRTQIRAKDFDKTCHFVEGWNPSSVTLKEIEELAVTEGE